MNDKIRLTRHPLQKLVKLASALGGSQANVSRNQVLASTDVVEIWTVTRCGAAV